MTTWILLFVLAVGDGAVSFQLEGFETKTECERAATVASQELSRRLWAVARTACIERRAAR